MSKGLRIFAGVVLIVVGAVVPGAQFLIGVGLSLALGAVLEKTPGSVERLQSQSVMVRSAIKPQEIVYGRTRKSGVVVWFGTSGTENKYLWFVLAVAEHEIGGYETLWLDQVAINIGSEIDGSGFVTNAAFIDADANNLVKTKFYSGQASQTADAELIAAFPDWTSNHKGNDVAYFWVRMEMDKSEGGTDPENPAANIWNKGWPRDISVTLTGAKIYDPAKDDINGGTGSHRVDTPSTWEWSNNPVLCRGDYLRHDRFGPGYTSANIDWAVVITQAAICDQAVTLPDASTQARYTMDGVVSVMDTPKSIVESMQTADMGTTLFFPAGIELHAGSWDAPSHTIDHTWIAGAYTAVSATETDSAYNAVRGQYLSANDNYTLVEFAPRTAAAFETEDGVGRVWEDIVLPFCTDELRAQRMAIVELKKSRQQTRLRALCNFRAEQIQTFQVVTIDLPGFSSETFRVIGKATSTDGTTSLELREEVSTDWDFTIPELAEPPIVPTVIRGNGTPSAPTNLSASSVPAGIQLFWDLPSLVGVSHIEVYTSATNDRSTVTRLTSTLSESYFHELAADTVRYYWILARAFNGLVSDWHPLSEPDTGLDGVEGTAGSAGADGLSVVVANVFIRKATAPTQPIDDDGSYDFGTKTLTPPSLAGGSADDWFTAPPAGTDPLYISTGSFSIAGQSGSDSTVTWTSPDILVSDGVDGDSVHVANAYTRSPTPPTTPIVDDGSYDFLTQTLTPPSIAGGSAEDWFTTPPTGSDPLYVVSGTFSVSVTSGTDFTVTWSSPDLLTNDGAGFVPDFTPGFVGGSSDFVYTLNANSSGAQNDGNLRIQGGTFAHPDGTIISTAANPFVVRTFYEGAAVGRFYLMFSATVAETRFGGLSSVWGDSDTRFISVTHDDANGWRARDNGGIYYAITVVATDCIIATCEKIATSGGINTIQILTSGHPGITIHVANAYLRKATAPATPIADDGQYVFETNVLTPPSIAGGSADDWAVTPPAGTDPLYVTSGSFSIVGNEGIDTTVDWTSPDLLVSDGGDGDSVHVANAYLRKATAPTTPIADDGAYNFTTKVLTPPSIAGGSADNWSTTPPGGNDPLYVCSGTFSINGVSGTDSTVTWSAADLLVQDGADAVVPTLLNANPVIAADIEGFNYATETANSMEWITGAGGTYEVIEGNVDITGTISLMYSQDSGDGWTFNAATVEWYKTMGGLRFYIHRNTGAYRIRITSTPFYRTWTSDTETVDARVLVNGLYYHRTYTITKAKRGNSSSVAALKPGGISFTEFASPAEAKVRLDNGGQYQKWNGTGYSNITAWLLDGTNSEYSVRATLISGTFSSGTFDTWLDLATDRTWVVQQVTSHGHNIGSMLIEIRRDSSGDVLVGSTAILDAFLDLT